jgi:adenylate cyclase
VLRFRALGRPVVEGPQGALGGAAAQRKPLALLALLAVAGSRGLSRDKILAYLWPETSADRATHRLTQLLYSLRHELGVDDLFLGSSALVLNQSVITTDIADFQQALADRCPERAVELYDGPFLDGFFVNASAEFEHWVDEERAELDRRYKTALEMLAERAFGKDDPPAAAHWCGRLAQADPLNGQVVLRYLKALVRNGDRAEAIRVGQSYKVRLREELDVEPDQAVVAAIDRLRGSAAEEPSVCVLPFVNLTPEHENDYFSDGMTEELTNALAQVPGLRVASRTSAFALKGKELDLRDIGARLGVRSIVEGSVRKVGNRIRITVQLVDTASGFHLWSQVFERTLHNVFALQEEISQAVARALPLGAGHIAASSLIRPPTVLVEAYTLYLRGRYFALKRTPDSLRLGIEYFEQAIELDSGYALAHAGIGECYTLLGFEEFGDTAPGQALPRAKGAVERALALDGSLAEGHTWRGVLAFLFEYEWSKAESSFLRAIQLKPAYSLAHTWYGVFLGAMGRNEEALARLRHAEQMDPLAVSVQAVLAHALYFVRDYPESLQRHLAVLEMDPGNPRIQAWLARLYHTTGQFEHGLKALESAIHRIGEPPILLAELGRFYGALGRSKEALQVIDKLKRVAGRLYVSSMAFACVHRELGNYDEMFEAVEQAFQEHSGMLPFLAVEPGWDSIRQDPRFQAFIERLGLESVASGRIKASAIPA